MALTLYFPLKSFLSWLGLGIRPIFCLQSIATLVMRCINVVIIFSSCCGNHVIVVLPLWGLLSHYLACGVMLDGVWTRAQQRGGFAICVVDDGGRLTSQVPSVSLALFPAGACVFMLEAWRRKLCLYSAFFFWRSLLKIFAFLEHLYLPFPLGIFQTVISNLYLFGMFEGQGLNFLSPSPLSQNQAH